MGQRVTQAAKHHALNLTDLRSEDVHRCLAHDFDAKEIHKLRYKL